MRLNSLPLPPNSPRKPHRITKDFYRLRKFFKKLVLILPVKHGKLSQGRAAIFVRTVRKVAQSQAFLRSTFVLIPVNVRTRVLSVKYHLKQKVIFTSIVNPTHIKRNLVPLIKTAEVQMVRVMDPRTSQRVAQQRKLLYRMRMLRSRQGIMPPNM